MIERIGAQAYTFRDEYYGADATEASLYRAFCRVRAMGYEEIQTAGWGKFRAETYAKLAHEAGLTIIGTHCGMEELTRDPDEAMRLHAEVLGTKIMGTGAMPGYGRTSVDGVKRFIEESNRLGETISKYGFKFTYHNHDFEFVKLEDGKTVMEHLAEGLDPATVSFCLDTHWVQRGGGNPTTWIERLRGRIDILHLKDMDVVYREDGEVEPRIVEVGSGSMDFDSIMEAAARSGVRYYCVEQDDCPGDPMDSLAISASYLRTRYMNR